MKYRLVLLLFVLSCSMAQAQYSMNSFVDVGNNYAAGTFGRIGLISSYDIDRYKVETGFLWTIPSLNHNGMAAWFLSGTAAFQIRRAKFEAGLFYRHQPFSSLIREHNWGFLLGFNSKHFCMKLGNNARTLKFTNYGMKQAGLTEDDDVKVSELRNAMFAFTYLVKPMNHYWNVAISVTNFDYFMIRQETNPFIMCHYDRRVKPSLKVYADLWYQSAGLLNLQVNYFGFYTRAGLKWSINK